MYENVVFTVCSVNYLAKAVVMMESITDNIERVIFLADKKRTLDINIGDIKIIFTEDLGLDRHNELAFKYNIIEFNTSVKPWIAMYLLKDFNKVIYLDPDTFVFSSLHSILQELQGCSFLMTPHSFSSPQDLERPSDTDLLKFGVYNLGFFACNQDENAFKILSWWHGKLLDECFYEPGLGLGVDQKIAELIPVFFEGVKISRNRGLNVAFWNLHERSVSKEDGIYHINCTEKLIFAHFSSYVSPKIIASKQSRFVEGDRSDFLELLEIYQMKLDSLDFDLSYEDEVYGYDYVKGYLITPLARRFYYHMLNAGRVVVDNPFESKRLFKILRKKGLILYGQVSKSHVNFNSISTQKNNIKIINLLFRMALKVLGPVRYFYFCRYINYITNTLNQIDILGDSK